MASNANSLLLRNLPRGYEQKVIEDTFEKAGEIIQTFSGKTCLILMFADESTREGAMMMNNTEVTDSQGRTYFLLGPSHSLFLSLGHVSWYFTARRLLQLRNIKFTRPKTY